MTYSKKNNVFQEISDTKWDEIKEEKARTASDGIELVKKFSREQCIEIKRISKLALVAPEFLTRKAWCILFSIQNWDFETPMILWSRALLGPYSRSIRLLSSRAQL